MIIHLALQINANGETCLVDKVYNWQNLKIEKCIDINSHIMFKIMSKSGTNCAAEMDLATFSCGHTPLFKPLTQALHKYIYTDDTQL